MRAALPVPLAVALAALSCGTEPAAAPPACDAPEGCLRVERIDGTCQCHEWQLVSIKPVAVKYVVVERENRGKPGRLMSKTIS